MQATLDGRLQRRRVRRLKRYARMIGPFLGVPLLLLTLSLSVDLIEYQPREEPDRLADHPIKVPRPKATQPVGRAGLLTTASVDLPIPSATAYAEGAGSKSIDLDVMLPSSAPPRTPTPPDALK